MYSPLSFLASSSGHVAAQSWFDAPTGAGLVMMCCCQSCALGDMPLGTVSSPVSTESI